MSALDGIVLRRSTTAQQVADALSERILAGAFPPGDRLRESAIATELGIARNTVREAVRILQLGGLVRHEVNRGAVVISPTAEQLAAVGAAFEALTQAAESREARLVVEKDLAFHAAIVTLLGSSRLNEFYTELIRELRYYLMVLSATDGEFENPETVISRTLANSTPDGMD